MQRYKTNGNSKKEGYKNMTGPFIGLMFFISLQRKFFLVATFLTTIKSEIMKKYFFFIAAIAITLSVAFLSQATAQTLSEFKTTINALDAACPTGDEDMDLLSCKMDNKNVTITFLLTEDPKDDGFTIKELNNTGNGTSDIIKYLMTYELFSDEETKDIVTGCASNNLNLQYCFVSKKNKKSHIITVTPEELKDIMNDAENPED